MRASNPSSAAGLLTQADAGDFALWVKTGNDVHCNLR
jgi:hypothetical protein